MAPPRPPKRIALVQGHPTPGGGHLCHALADAYAAGAAEAGHAVRRIEVAELDFPLLRSKAEWELGPAPASLAGAQAALSWCEHLVILHPLWLGDMPALLKGFLEQVLRPGVAVPEPRGSGPMPLAGRSARVVVTMGMPGLVYRLWFGAPSLRLLRRHILGFVGFRPIRATILGMVEGASAAKREGWLAEMRALGRRAG